MSAGAVEWMQAGGGIWHTGKGISSRLKGYQLWVALPPDLENAAALSRYLGPEHFPTIGPARVILGELGAKRSPIRTPSSMNYFDVRLKAGESWRYEPAPGHDVAWIAVHQGSVSMDRSQMIPAGELAVFEKGEGCLTFQALDDTGFVLCSAAAHPHELIMGYYSVHTSARALAQGEANIERMGREIRQLVTP